ncbi:MAG: gliding motility-associated C-terminal domain-containing protein [Bacteroidota bacterium]
MPVNIIVLDSLDAINPNLFSNSPLCDIDTLFLISDADPSSDFYWSGPLGYTSTDSLPIITNLTNLNSGIYTLYVYVDGCFSYQSSIPVTINSTPEISTSNDTLICINDQVELFAYGGVSYVWSPSIYLDDFLISNPISIPDSSISYNVTITDANNCTNSATVNIIVQNTPYLSYNFDTTIIVGESVSLLVSSNENIFDFFWSPDYNISCINCFNPTVNPLNTTEYIFNFTDSLGCIYPYISIEVIVLDEFTLDVPMAFTPNGDGNNDIVYVRGWGIKELLEFRIYNRWGQEIFYTDDINQGWDGTYLGKPQNIDTYAYYVKARFYNNVERDKKGTITLLR